MSDHNSILRCTTWCGFCKERAGMIQMNPICVRWRKQPILQAFSKSNSAGERAIGVRNLPTRARFSTGQLHDWVRCSRNGKLIQRRINMACVHLRRLYELCQTGKLCLGTSDLIQLVCGHCRIVELCPSVSKECRDPIVERAAEQPVTRPSRDNP
jgi:hypothetical protein